VKVSGGSTPKVVDHATNQDVVGAKVRSITFPTQSSAGSYGSVNYVSGPGTAVIEVNGAVISGVPLC
jgi:hypothetical protein